MSGLFQCDDPPLPRSCLHKSTHPPRCNAINAVGRGFTDGLIHDYRISFMAMPTIYEFASWLILAQAEGKADGAADGAGKEVPDAGPKSLIDGCGPMMLPMVLIFVLFYFMMMRPQAKERKKMREMLDNMKKNDRVVTAGGILGTVVNVQKDSPYVTIKIDEQTNAKLKIKRTSIISIESDDVDDSKDKDKVKKDEI